MIGFDLVSLTHRSLGLKKAINNAILSPHNLALINNHYIIIIYLTTKNQTSSLLASTSRFSCFDFFDFLSFNHSSWPGILLV